MLKDNVAILRRGNSQENVRKVPKRGVPNLSERQEISTRHKSSSLGFINTFCHFLSCKIFANFDTKQKPREFSERKRDIFLNFHITKVTRRFQSLCCESMKFCLGGNLNCYFQSTRWWWSCDLRDCPVQLERCNALGARSCISVILILRAKNSNRRISSSSSTPALSSSFSKRGLINMPVVPVSIIRRTAFKSHSQNQPSSTL